MTESKIIKGANILKEVKRFRKEFNFTARILKDSLPVARGKKIV